MKVRNPQSSVVGGVLFCPSFVVPASSALCNMCLALSVFEMSSFSVYICRFIAFTFVCLFSFSGAGKKGGWVGGDLIFCSGEVRTP